MPFNIIRDDITRVRADAIVNTANPKPVIGDGTDRAIYQAAGEEALLRERHIIGTMKRGEAAATPAFALPARFVIHTVGPDWQGGNNGEYETLASCYRKSLLLARQLGCESIAFPLIAAGYYGFPKDKALSIALEEISAFLRDFEMDVTLVVFDRQSFELSAALTDGVRQFIDDHYVEERRKEEHLFGSIFRRFRKESGRKEELPPVGRGEEMSSAGRMEEMSSASRMGGRPSAFPERFFGLEMAEDELLEDAAPEEPTPVNAKAKPELPEILKHLGESFRERLFRLIDERKLTDAEVYHKANVDRKLFSKIRCKEDYIPRKRTVLALAIALELSLEETADLLRRAGWALSPSSKFDLIVEYCIENGKYNIYEINALLFKYGQPMLGNAEL